MAEQIFREKILKKIKTPDKLNEYIKVANPGMWLGLAAVVIALVGILIWSCVANLETVVVSGVVVQNGMAKCYIKETDLGDIDIGTTVIVNDTEYSIISRDSKLVTLDPTVKADANIMNAMNISDTEVWVTTFNLDAADLKDGTYRGKIVTSYVKPISFLINSDSQ